jgi:hypothetical protein
MLFEIVDFEPKPSTEFMLIKEFEALFTIKYNKGFDGDAQGRERRRGTAEAKFLYFHCDYRSEFAKYDTVERMEHAFVAAGLDPDYVISDELRAAIGRYLALRDSRNLRLLQATWKAVDKLQKWFEDVDFTKPEYDAKEVMSNIANLGKVIKGLGDLEENVRAEESQTAGTRGDAEGGRLK